MADGEFSSGHACQASGRPARGVAGAVHSAEFDIDSGVSAYVAMMRQQVAPAPNARGAWLETFNVWVITPSAADSPELEGIILTGCLMKP